MPGGRAEEDHEVHELALCAAAADTVTVHAGAREVRRVHLRIGYLRQVVPETLEFCWSMQTGGTNLDGCELAVEHVPAVIDCHDCAQRTTLTDPFLICGTCDSADVELISGEEFEITGIDVAREVSSSTQEAS